MNWRKYKFTLKQGAAIFFTGFFTQKEIFHSFAPAKELRIKIQRPLSDIL